MRVKRLEIEGFKSFKDKTVVHFDHPITGIVGPNGCGKSNIVDAFFWVMGEQSYKHMRGSGSDDLIFNGSSQYSPLGIAECTLVLETDVVDTQKEPAGASAQDLPVHLRSKEISVTRRVYRGGEGEYLINGVTSRLRDIQELFMDTGVGAKGYSVIEQGQIGKVVNAKPEERRLLVEEAAGIAKYKARKRESLRKMEATQQNLARLQDILQEIQRSLNSLERQAQRARKYREYKQELLEKEVGFGKRKTKLFTKKIEALKTDHVLLEENIVAAKAEIQTLENNVETARVAQLSDSKTIEDLQSQIQETSRSLTQQQSALEISRRRQEDLNRQLESLNSEKNQLEVSLEASEQELIQKKEGLSDFEAELKSASTQVTSRGGEVEKRRQEMLALRQELEGAREQLMQVSQRSSEILSQNAFLTARIETGQVQMGRLETQQGETQSRLEQIQQEHQKIHSDRAKLEEDRQQQQVQVETLQSRLETVEGALENLYDLRDQTLAHWTQLKSNLESLEALDRAYEGLGLGPKSALEWARQKGLEGNIHLLANEIEVQSGYEKVVECALERQLESLLVKDLSVGTQALDYLESSQKGRAHFHEYVSQTSSSEPSNTASFTELKQVLGDQGFNVLGNLKEFVSLKKEAASDGSDFLNAWLDKTVVVSDFSWDKIHALAPFKDRLIGWALIGVSGRLVEWKTQGTSFQGGFSDADQAALSLLERKRSIRELSEKVSAAQAEKERVHQEWNQNFEEKTQLEGQLEIQRADLHQSLVKSSVLERDAHQADRVLRELKSTLELLVQEQEEKKAEIQDALSQQKGFESEKNQLESDLQQLQERLKTEDSALVEQTQKLADEEVILSEMRVQEASLKERIQSIYREIETAQSFLEQKRQRITNVDQLLGHMSQERDQHQGGDASILHKVEEYNKLHSMQQKELSQAKDQMERMARSVDESMEKMKSLRQVEQEQSQRLNGLALEREKLSSELHFLVQNLEEKYGPGCLNEVQTEGEAAPEGEVNPEEELLLAEEIERIRERIRRLGEVNPQAVEEYEELKKRFDHLDTEKKDLEHSIENLQLAIEHINKTSEERFKKAFAAIAQRFEKLFPIIFGGGKAELSLVFPEGSTDILEVGIDILAQPPGKKIVNITLLSGGEKALTALSLIFAIFMVKPSPFCILDEVDAPLDDANVGKFNALLKEMAAKTQFILITHNKKTMELNDSLYGVTMEEPGVSKMISIEMR